MGSNSGGGSRCIDALRCKRNREAEQEAYRRCKTARQTDLRVMLAGPKGRAVGESGELDTGCSQMRKGDTVAGLGWRG
eukprot:1175995-Prorocentrum_minimum.AAC.1